MAPAMSERVPGWATVVSIAIPGGPCRMARPRLRDLTVLNSAVSGEDPQATADTAGTAAVQRYVMATVPLRTQASTMLAVDFFHVDCAVTLQRICVFFARKSETATCITSGRPATQPEPGPASRPATC
jgi:hypothetical protein